MGRLVLYIAASLDGFIAGEGYGLTLTQQRNESSHDRRSPYASYGI